MMENQKISRLLFADTTDSTIRNKFCKLILLTAFILCGGNVYAQESIGVYFSPPGEMQFNPDHIPDVIHIVEEFENIENWPPDEDGYNSDIGTYWQLSGSSSINPGGQFGAGTGAYLAIPANGHVTLELDEPVDYFGLAWPAGDGQNRVEIFRDGVSIFELSTQDVQDMLPNNQTEITALDGSTYITQDYYGQPGTGDNNNEPYSFIHIVASEGLEFDRIDFFQVPGSGQFETDNHTIIEELVSPIDKDNSPWVEVFEIEAPEANDDESLNNTPGSSVTVDILGNDEGGTDQNGEHVPLNPESVIITGEIPEDGILDPNGKTFEVPGEGTWTVDEDSGQITFTPEPGFLGNPTPIQYRVRDENDTASNIATVTVTYLPEIEANDETYGPINGETGDPDIGNILDNDTFNGDPATPDDVEIIVEPGDLPEGITVDLQTGQIGVEPGTPAGEYEFEYEICNVETDDWQEAEVCDTATVTIEVVVPPGVEIEVGLTIDECWRMLASPVQTTYGELLDGLWTEGFPGSNDPSATLPNVYTWPTDAEGNDESEWQPLSSLDDEIPAGSGFIISVIDQDGTGFPKTIQVNGTGYLPGVQAPLNEHPEGWSLVGNPFDVPVSFDDLTRGGLTDVAYVYDRNAGGTTGSNSGGWRSTDGTFGEIEDGVIAAFQGFFVQNFVLDNGAIPALTFTEEAKTDPADGEFYGKQNEQTPHFVRLELEGEELSNAVWLTFGERGDHIRIRGDAMQLIAFSEHYAMVSAVKTDQSLYDIAHFPSPGEATYEIPLHVESTRPGTYSLSSTDLDLPEDLNAVFYDRQADREVPLDALFTYEFSIDEHQAGKAKNASADEGPFCEQLGTERLAENVRPVPARAISQESRFVIRVMGEDAVRELPAEVSLEQNYPNPFNPVTQISYQLPQTADVTLEVFDMLGRRVAVLVEGMVQAGHHTASFDASNLSSGVYMYRLHAGGVVMSRKLTVIK